MAISSTHELQCFATVPTAHPAGFDTQASALMSGFFTGNRRDVPYSAFEFAWYKPVSSSQLNDKAYGIVRHIAKNRVLRFSAEHMQRVDATAWQDIAQDMYNMAKG